MATRTTKTVSKKSTAKADAVKAALKKMVKTSTAKSASRGSAPHLIVVARAGTGKTTTLIGGLNALMGSTHEVTPSVQQQAIWEAICAEKPESIKFVAFNKSIANELAARVPSGVEATTLHSAGNSIVQSKLPRYTKPNGYKTDNIVERLTGKDSKALWKDGYPINLLRRLVSLCKMELIDWKSSTFADDLDALAAHHDLDMNGSRTILLDMIPKILTEACDMTAKKFEIDFDDMIWLPVICDLPVRKDDLLMVDEAQDLNRCQQQLVLRMAHRLVFCGDPKQAIYGFAGADCKSMQRLEETLSSTDRGVKVLPLTTTYRCGHAIVAEANSIVPDFYAADGNPKGMITNLSENRLLSEVSDANMVLCRINAHLVSVCFRNLKAGRKARIQGRDIGEGLIALIKKFRASSVGGLIEALEEWHQKETEKLMKKKFTPEAQIIALNDKHDCLVTFCSASDTVQGVIDFIQKVFSDDGPGVLLSSIHRAKGLEATKVYILQPEKMPHPMAKSQWQVEQEYNLKYVAITRAKETLVYVNSTSSVDVENE